MHAAAGAAARFGPPHVLLDVGVGDLADPESAVARAAAGAEQPDAPEANAHPNVSYVGYERWIDGQLHKGAALDPRDQDPIYEQ